MVEISKLSHLKEGKNLSIYKGFVVMKFVVYNLISWYNPGENSIGL